VKSILIERKGHASRRSKAPGIHVRTREIFRQWGIEDRFLATGTLLQQITLYSPSSSVLGSIDFSSLEPEADRPGLLVLEQGKTEKLLLDAVRETGLCDVRFTTEAVALEQNAENMQLLCRGGADTMIDARYVVGCDGAGSFIRQALGLPFDGFTYSVRPMLADVRIKDVRDDLPWPRIWNSPGGITAAIRLEAGLWRLIRLEKGQPDADETVPEQEIATHVAQTLGVGPFDVEWANRFRIHLRSAPTFRVGRVLLAGDAAHIHSPAGGLGMNAGIQDAHNLAWKLAAAMRGGNEESLLSSYDVERRSVTVEEVSRYADSITRIFLQSPKAVRTLAFLALRPLLAVPPIRKIVLQRLTMIDLAYAASPLLRPGSKAIGKRLPNPVLRSPDGSDRRLYELVPNAAFLIHLTDAPADGPPLPLEHVIRIGAHGYRDVAGVLRQMAGRRGEWILVRSDLHIAWVGETMEGLDDIMRETLGSVQ